MSLLCVCGHEPEWHDDGVCDHEDCACIAYESDDWEDES